MSTIPALPGINFLAGFGAGLRPSAIDFLAGFGKSFIGFWRTVDGFFFAGRPSVMYLVPVTAVFFGRGDFIEAATT